ncbi:BTAD domain-containing putative transcriptional regulator (plasmid) [Salipiger sp. H15]|uniref:BTAD domain-containing putative transcriptional regulator n=1 Tax=Alloyangia sp. H15 TaxID=3029062 RepID=A0AAU8AS52_9RHOB
MVLRDGAPVELPRSRKLRALLALLILETVPVSRQHLCEVLWECPNDPRGELRWYLAKLRRIVDQPERRRLISSADTVALDLDGCAVDALRVLKMMETSQVAGRAKDSRNNTGLELFRGMFLGDLDLTGSQASLWLNAQRRRFAGCELKLLQHQLELLPPASELVAPLLDRWLELTPYDIAAHRALLEHLALRGRQAEAETHVATAVRLFAEEGVPEDGLRRIWNEIRHRTRPSPATNDVSPAKIGPPGATDKEHARQLRPGLAVMPFRFLQDWSEGPAIALGLTRDVITRMAKLRSLAIIALGSTEAAAGTGRSAAEVGSELGVSYVATGVLRKTPDRLALEIDLIETETAHLVWTEVCEAPSVDLLGALDTLGRRVVAALTAEIEQAERNRAILRPPTSLDAWSLHHRGMWHMYRFTRADNARATQYFRQSVARDPTFSRAFAGLSFTHWQNAFQHWSDPTGESESAYACAMQSLQADEHDPAAHWALGRALWLRRQHAAAASALRRSVELSPNFAHGHYSLAFVEAQSGDPQMAIQAADTARTLSPLDPLLFGMLGTRAIAHLRLGQFDEAADWALRAVARPNAHVNILGIAALTLSLAGRVPEGRSMAAAIHATQPGYDVDSFLSAFHFSPERARQLRSAAAKVVLG